MALLTPVIALLVVASGALPPAPGAWIALLVVFFAPGFLLWLALPQPVVRDAAALPAIIFVVSFALIAPSLLVALAFNTSVQVVLWSLVAELVVLSWFAARREGIPVRWPRARVTFLLILIAVAGAATFRYFVIGEQGDDRTYVGLIETIKYTDSFPSRNPFLAADLPLAPRWAMNGWVAALGTVASLSDVEGIQLFLQFLPPLLLVLGASAAYLLARFLGRSERFGLAAAAVAVLLPLITEPLANPSQFLFWYRAIQQDKYTGLLIFFPVVVTFFLATFHRPRLSLAAASAGLLLAVVLVHPLIAAFVILVVGAYAVTHSALNLRFPIRRLLVLAVTVAPGLAAGAILSLTQGGFGVDFGDIASLSDVFVQREFGPITYWAPRRGVGPSSMPIDEGYRFFINYHLTIGEFSRAIFFTKNLFMVSPRVLTAPVNLIVPVAAMLMLVRQRRHPLTAFIIGSSLSAVTVLFFPPAARIVAVAVPPFQLWRFSWLLPVGLAAAWVYTVWLRQADHAWAIAGYALLALVAMWTPHDELLALRTAPEFTFAPVAEELEKYDGVLLSPGIVADPLGPEGLRPIVYRGGAVMSNAFPRDRRQELLLLMRDRARFYEGPTAPSERLATIRKHGITHVLIMRGTKGALGIPDLPLRHVADVPMGFILYEVVAEAPTSRELSAGGGTLVAGSHITPTAADSGPGADRTIMGNTSSGERADVAGQAQVGVRPAGSAPRDGFPGGQPARAYSPNLPPLVARSPPPRSPPEPCRAAAGQGS